MRITAIGCLGESFYNFFPSYGIKLFPELLKS